jgi:hypothetical protein
MAREPSKLDITPTTPLRLAVAAALAYPDGSMTASGLRREAKRGRLVIERTAGKDYTTLAAIERMRELCRKPPKDRDSSFAANGETNPAPSPTRPYGSSGTMVDTSKALDAALTIVNGLSSSSPNTSRKNGSTAHAAPVIRLPSRSPT